MSSPRALCCWECTTPASFDNLVGRSNSQNMWRRRCLPRATSAARPSDRWQMDGGRFSELDSRELVEEHLFRDGMALTQGQEPRQARPEPTSSSRSRAQSSGVWRVQRPHVEPQPVLRGARLWLAWRRPCRRPAWRPLHSLAGRASYQESTGLRSHGSLKSARLRRKSKATSSTLRPCKSTAALRAAIVSLLSWPDSFSKGALICGNRSKVVLRTTGASM